MSATKRAVTINQGSSYSEDLLAEEFGGYFCVVDLNTPAHGSFVKIASNKANEAAYTYTPDRTFHGQVSMTYVITDACDEMDCLTHWEEYVLTITVLPNPTFICATSNRDTWQNHRNAVKAKQGNLLTIPDQATQTYIENNFASNHYFIGLKDVSTGSDPRNFKWDDNDSSTYRNWAPNEPNNWGGREDCGEVSPPGGWKWNDQGCWRQRWALVEFPWSEYNNIVCDTSNIYTVCHPGPGNTFATQSCPQTAPEFIESASGSDKMSQGSVIGGSVAIGVILTMSLMAVIYLGKKNQWSWWKKNLRGEQLAPEELDESGLQQNGLSSNKLSHTVEGEHEEETTAVENC